MNKFNSGRCKRESMLAKARANVRKTKRWVDKRRGAQNAAYLDYGQIMLDSRLEFRKAMRRAS